jgi:hypothetical protein
MVDIVNDDPAIWIERVFIYENLTTKPPLQDFALKRGLNIIEGLSSADGTNGQALAGHSVGKTTLCRLIRFCLDDVTFGNDESVRQISNYLRDGGVAATLWIRGTRWSVIRPFSRHASDSRAAVDKTIEELREMASRDADYSLYQNELRRQIVGSVPGFDKVSGLKWVDLLGWLVRDQEARLQSLWHWRDTRSNSQVKQLHKPLAYRLMRAVLGLYSEAERDLANDLDATTKQLKDETDRFKADERRRDLDRASYDRSVKAILSRHGWDYDASATLLGADNVASSFQLEIERRIANLEGERTKAQWIQDRCRSDVREFQRRIQEVRRQLTPIAESIEHDGPEDDIKELDESERDNCDFGGIPFSQCNFRNERLKSLRDRLANVNQLIADDYVGDRSVELSRIQDVLIAETFSMTATRDVAVQKLAEYNARLQQIDSEVRALWRDVDRLQFYVAGRSTLGPNQSIEDLVRPINDRLDAIKGALERVRLENSRTRSDVSSCFARLVKHVLSGDYAGLVRFTNEDNLDFRISGMTGEAVTSLTSVLADISAVLLSVSGVGSHPRFLVHDSPREADLSATAYSSILQKLAMLTEQMGGEAAPFQYIVTTTTPPPANLISYRRLILSNEPESKMLFRKNIAVDPDLNLDLVEEV